MVTINVTAQLRALHDSVDNLEQMNRALRMLVVLQDKLLAAYRLGNKCGIDSLLQKLHEFKDLIARLGKENGE